jgi:hypothetical protein
VKKYEAGDVLYEMKGLRDGYGSKARLALTVTREGDVTLTMEENDPENPDLSIRFNHNASEQTSTPYMAERLARIPRTIFEKEGKWLDDDPDYKVSSLQGNLRIMGRDNSSQGNVRGIIGDGDEGTTMNLYIGGGGDVTIALVTQPTDVQSFRMVEMIFPTSPAGVFYSGTLNELREAARNLISSQTSSS